MKMQYEPWKFINLAESELGIMLWDFLTKQENIIRMETASELKKPAAKALSTRLLNKFGDKVKELRTKQMIGHMIKQIMEARGLEIDQRNVLVNDGLFNKASRYKRNK